MTLRHRLALSFFSILALFAVNLGVHFWGNRTRREATEHRYRALSRQIQIASIEQRIRDLQRQVALLHEVTPETANSGARPEDIVEFSGQVADVQTQIRTLGALSDREGRPEVAAFEKAFRELGESWGVFYRNLGKNQVRAITELVFHADPLSEDILRQLHHLKQAEQKRADAAGRRFTAVTDLTERITVLLFVLSMLLAVTVAFLLSRHLTGQLSALEEGAALIGSGDLHHRIAVRSRDELGQLAQAFNLMAENLLAARNRFQQVREELERRHEELEQRDAELRAMNARLVSSEQRAQAANAAKSAFVANMSHELRTPLNAILGYSEMLQEEAQEAQQTAALADLRKIHAAGRHLLALINDILDFSKIEAGRMDLFLERFEIAPLVQEVVTTIAPLVSKNHNTLEVEAAGEPGSMRADLTKLRQSLFNLLSNACKFTEQGRITLTVSRETSEGGEEWVVFGVGDTGIGMSGEQMSRLFQEFSQADASTTRRFGGTGLGLVISRHFCRMMGGDITVESEPGRGTTFTLKIPANVREPGEEAAEPDPGDPNPGGETASAAVTPAAGSAGTVLVIDDDAGTRELLRRFLTREGYRVECAAGGEQGLKLAREMRPEVITLDVMMPQMDGWAVLSSLKSDPALAATPVVMLTIVDEYRTGYALGAADYLTKPVDRERLVAVLAKYHHEGQARLALVVEDDRVTRQMMRRMLEREGWEVAEASNGRAGLGRVAQRLPGVILLDLMMPWMDGFAFVEELRAREAWRAVPVVVVTAKELTPAERQRLSGKVAKILQKGSYSQEELMREVSRLVGSSLGKAGTASTTRKEHHA